MRFILCPVSRNCRLLPVSARDRIYRIRRRGDKTRARFFSDARDDWWQSSTFRRDASFKCKSRPRKSDTLWPPRKRLDEKVTAQSCRVLVVVDKGAENCLFSKVFHFCCERWSSYFYPTLFPVDSCCSEISNILLLKQKCKKSVI